MQEERRRICPIYISCIYFGRKEKEEIDKYCCTKLPKRYLSGNYRVPREGTKPLFHDFLVYGVGFRINIKPLLSM